MGNDSEASQYRSRLGDIKDVLYLDHARTVYVYMHVCMYIYIYMVCVKETDSRGRTVAES